MIPLALLLISTWVTGSILPVATTDRARSRRSTLASFSGSILVGFLPMAFMPKKPPAPRIVRVRTIQTIFLRLRAAMALLLQPARLHGFVAHQNHVNRCH